MLERGDQVPHFTVTQTDGSRANYSDIWQRRNLVLVCVPGGIDFAAGLKARASEVHAHDAVCVITAESIPGLPCPGIVVADRWGEIYFVTGASDVAALPSFDEILDWLRYVAHECPECQGETR